MRRRLSAALLAVVTFTGLSVVTAPAAHAGTCTARVLCGVVNVSDASQANVSITDRWPAGNVHVLTPGQRSSIYFKDTDGYRVPSNCTAVVNGVLRKSGGVWHKINDLQHVTIKAEC